MSEVLKTRGLENQAERCKQSVLRVIEDINDGFYRKNGSLEVLAKLYADYELIKEPFVVRNSDAFKLIWNDTYNRLLGGIYSANREIEGLSKQKDWITLKKEDSGVPLEERDRRHKRMQLLSTCGPDLFGEIFGETINHLCAEIRLMSEAKNPDEFAAIKHVAFEMCVYCEVLMDILREKYREVSVLEDVFWVREAYFEATADSDSE